MYLPLNQSPCSKPSVIQRLDPLLHPPFASTQCGLGLSRCFSMIDYTLLNGMPSLTFKSEVRGHEKINLILNISLTDLYHYLHCWGDYQANSAESGVLQCGLEHLWFGDCWLQSPGYDHTGSEWCRRTQSNHSYHQNSSTGEFINWISPVFWQEESSGTYKAICQEVLAQHLFSSRGF